MYATVVILALIISSNAVLYENETAAEFHDKQAKLISHLFSGYNKEVPPISIREHYSSATIEPLDINITLVYAKLLSVNEPNQTIDMLIDYILCWNDGRLTWNPNNFDEFKAILINRNFIWRADLLLSESTSTTDMRDSQLQHASVDYNGNVELYMASAITFRCSLNVARFPFDDQVCNLTFTSLDNILYFLRINANISEDYDISDPNTGVWTVYGPIAGTLLRHGRIWASYKFYFRRYWVFYGVVIIMPSFLLTFLCVIGMFRFKSDNANYLEKLGLGFTAILAKCTILQLLEVSVPKATGLSALSLYVMVNLMLVGLAMLITILSSEICSLSKFAIPTMKTKKWTRESCSSFSSFTNFRVICLILFPLATIVNLVVLLSDVRKCVKCELVEKSLATI